MISDDGLALLGPRCDATGALHPLSSSFPRALGVLPLNAVVFASKACGLACRSLSLIHLLEEFLQGIVFNLQRARSVWNHARAMW